ncbi:MAG: 50S ribosomal protein L13 [Candidatus Woesearchaeota archaeon]
MIVIDANNMILGRLATYAAKQALLGQEVRVINAEKAVLSGKKANTIAELSRRNEQGIPAKGPFLPKMPDRFVRKTIRGMLPYKQPKGAEAFKRILCYSGVPEEFKEAKPVEINNASAGKLPTLNKITVGEALKRFR